MRINSQQEGGHYHPLLLIIVLISLITIMSMISCTSKSGQRAKSLTAKAPPSWTIVDYAGDDSYDAVTYNQVQDYLNIGFIIYSPSNETSLLLDSYDRYQIINTEAEHSGIISFDRAFKLFYEEYCPEYTLPYDMLKRQALMIGYVPMQLPVD